MKRYLPNLIFERSHYINILSILFLTLVSLYATALPSTTVNSISRTASNPNNGSITLTWDVNFGAAVAGVTASNFTTQTTGTMNPGAPVIGGGGILWTVSITIAPTTDGTVGISLDNATGLDHSISTALPFVGEVYTIDITPPTNQNAVFTASVDKQGGSSVTLTAGSAADFNWMAPATTVSFVANGTTITTAAGDATSIVAPSTEGFYKLFVLDAAGNASSASTATLTVDNTAPTNQNTVFASSISKQGGASVTIVSSGDATNEVWFAPSGTISFSPGLTMTKAASGTATSINAPANEGNYRLFVIDAAGNVSNQSTAILAVDNTNPVISATAPTTGSFVNTTKVSYTLSEAVTSGTITFTRTSGSPDGGSPHVQALAGGELSSGAHNNITLTNNPALVDGTVYTIDFDATDAAGNGASTVTNTSITYDISAPTNQNTVFASSTSQQGGTSVTIVSSGDATNEVWFAPSGTISFSPGPTMTKAASGTATSINAPANEGNYRLFVIDAAGNISNQSTAVLTVDNTAPTNQNAVFSSSVSKQGGALITIVSSGDATNEVWFAPSGTISFSPGPTMTKAASGTATSINAPANEGNYRLFVIDAAGNVSNQSTALLTVDNTNPVISATSPTNGSFVNTTQVSYTLSEAVTSGTITFTRTSGSLDGGSPHIQALAGGELSSGVHNNITLTNNPALVDGTVYTIDFDATDAAGNGASTVTNTSITYDISAPTNQNTVFASSTSQQGVTSVTIVSSGDPTNEVWFAPPGTGSFSAGPTMTQAASGISTSILSPANEGPYRLYLIDAAGNVSNQSNAILTVDNTPPTIQTVGTVIATGAPVSAGYWNNFNTGIDITVPLEMADATLDGGSIQIQAHTRGNAFENFGPIFTISTGERGAGTKTVSITDLVPANGTPDFEEITGYVDGDTVNITAVVTDNVGNMATFNQSVTETYIDTSPPVVVSDEFSVTSPTTIVFTTNEELFIPAGPINGFSIAGTGSFTSAAYSGKGSTNTITITGTGFIAPTTTVSYTPVGVGGGGAVDLALNEMVLFSGQPTTENIINLSAGDIAITSYSADGDKFAFVLLKDISSGTKIKFTDNGWKGTVKLAFTTKERIVTWEANSYMFAGTEITIVGTTPSIGMLTAPDGALELADDGDQLLAYQGTESNPAFLSAIQMHGSSWDGDFDKNDKKKSAIPAGLSDGTNAIVFSSEKDNASYDRFTPIAGAITAGTPAVLLTAIMGTDANWDRDNNVNNVSYPTGGDNYTIPPDLQSTTPANGSTVSANLSQLVFTYDAGETMSLFNGTVDLNLDDGTPVATWNTVTDAANFSITNNVVTLDISTKITFSALDDGKVYEVNVSDRAFENSLNNRTVALVGDTDMKFTMDAIAPTVLSINRDPAVIVNTNFGTSASSVTYIVTFSEPVQAGTVTIADFTPAGAAKGGTSVTNVTGSDDTYTVTVSSINLLGDLTIDFIGSIDDLVGNTGSTGKTGDQSFIIINPEPSQQPTAFTAPGTPDHYTLTLSWTPGAGTQLADGYIVFIKGPSGTFPADPVDLIVTPDDLTIGFAEGAKNTATNSVTFTGLNSGTTYDFKIYPYTNSGNQIDYKIDGTILTGSGTTTVASESTISFVSSAATISSVTNDLASSSINYTFDITDDGTSAALDNAPTYFSQFVIFPGTGNDIAWTDAIQGIEINDGTNVFNSNINGGDIIITNTEITINNIPNGAGQLGEILDNGTKNYNLRIWLKNPLANAVLQTTIDGLNFVFQVNESSSFSYDDVSHPQKSSKIKVGETSNSAATNNKVTVTATQLDWIISPRSTEGINQNLQEPEVRARDANSNLDLDYNYSAVVQRGPGLSTTGMSSIPTLFVNGILTFPGFQYTVAGDGTLTITGSDPMTLTQTDANHVDVVHVNGITADTGAPAGSDPSLNNGITTETDLAGGSVNRVIFGATFDAPYTVAGQPTLQDFTIRFGNSITNVLQNIRLYESTDNSFDISVDPEITGSVTIDQQSDHINLQGINHDFSAGPTVTYFLMVDISVLVNSTTPSITPSLVKPDQFSTDIVMVPNASSFANIPGDRTFAFTDITPPVVVAQTPVDGEANFSFGSDIQITFNEAVTTQDRIISIFLLDGTPVRDIMLRAPDPSTNTTFNFPTVEVDPITGLDLPGPIQILNSDTWYYVTIKPGDNATQGFSDISGNTFQGITSNTAWKFKTSDLTPPEVVSTMPTSVDNRTLVGGNLKVALNETGKVFFLVTNTGAAPTISQIIDPTTFSGEITSGQLDIVQDSVYHYAPIFSSSFINGTTYEVHYVAKDNAQPSNVMVIPLMVTFKTSNPAGSGLIIESPTYNICEGNFQITFPPFSITERNTADFPNTSGQTFNLVLPTGYEFNTNALNDKVLVQGGDITSASKNYLNNTILQVVFNVTGGTDAIDKITLSGLEILANNGSTSDSIKRIGGNALLGSGELPDGSVIGTINTVGTPIITFHTDPNNTSIGNNIPKVTLIPDVSFLDFGTNVFSGAGVSGDTLFTAFAQLGSHVITLTHTTTEGCVSTYDKTILIFDNERAIAGLEPLYCTDDPDASILFTGKLPDFTLDNLTISLPSSVLLPDSSVVLATSDTVSSSFLTNLVLPGLTGPFGGDYVFSPKIFGDSVNFNRFTNEGGHLVDVEFKADYKSVTTTIVDTFKQVVQIYIPPTNSITFTNARLGTSATFGDNIVDVTNVDPNDPNFPLEYCEDDLDINLDGLPNPSTGSSQGFFAVAVPTVFAGDSVNFAGLADQGDGSAILNTQTVADNFGFGDFDIKYIYENLTSQCNDTVTKTIRITPKPRAGFTTSLLCEDTPIRFVDLSGYTPSDSASVAAAPNNAILPNIVKWTWKFNDANSTGGNPDDVILTDVTKKDSVMHTFSAPGIYAVDLSIINQFGCVADTTINLVVGGIPDTNFEFAGSSLQDTFTFQSSSVVEKSSATLDQAIDSLIWDFGDGSVLADDDNDPTRNNDTIVTHLYTTSGLYNVQLDAYSTVGCSRVLSKPLYVLQDQAPDSVNIYSEDFENNEGGWTAFADFNPVYNPISKIANEQQLLEDSISWGWGAPTNSTIVPGILQGTNIWVTGLAGPYRGNERSFVYSPNFDLTNIPRPMIAADIYQQLEDGDGVILEFSTDTLNILDPRKTWNSVGTQLNEGKNWFNGIGLAGAPGVDISGLGWEGTSSGWVLARHTLGFTGLTTQAERSRVIFRFGIGAVSQPKKDGFAFDNVIVGNRTRTVLLENFTNVQGPADTKSENDAVSNLSVDPSGSELVIIEYHTSFPGEDIMNQANKSDQDARALYYGISQTPRVAIDGTTDPLDRVFTQWGNLFYLVRTLNVSPFVIDLSTSLATDGKLKVHAVLHALKNIAPNYVVHVAVVEKSINAVQLGSNANIGTGETDFQYVLKAMLPDAGGTKYNNLLALGDSVVIDQSWNPTNVISVGNKNLRVIVFVQDEKTREVYQAAYVDPGFDPVLGIEEELKTNGLAVYPNPVDRMLTIQLAEKAHVESRGLIIDNTGRKVKELTFHAGQQQMVLPTSTFTPGLYHLQIETHTGVKKIRFIISHR